MNPTRLTKKAFEYDYALCNKNWCSELKHILTSLDLANYYTSKTVIDLKVVESKLREYYSNQWKAIIESKPKLRTYTKFKHEFKTENYIILNLSKHERSIITQFRAGILPLRLETGRYINEPLENRLCTMCTENCIEDETHFLLSCQKYNNIRTDVFGEIVTRDEFNSLNDVEKIEYLFTNCVRKVAKYLIKAFLMRRDALYRHT